MDLKSLSPKVRINYRAVKHYLGLMKGQIIRDPAKYGIHTAGGSVGRQASPCFIAFDPEQIKSVKAQSAKKAVDTAAENSDVWKIVKGWLWDQRPDELKILKRCGTATSVTRNRKYVT